MEDHLALAGHNQEVIDFLLKSPDSFHDWITTVAFYKSLHLVEALFACDRKIQHGRNHQTRRNILKKERRYEHIYQHYRFLEEASSVARYLGDNSGKFYNCFNDYGSMEFVKTEIIGHHLHQIDKSVSKLLSKPTGKARKKK